MSYEEDKAQAIAISVAVNNTAVLAAATADPFTSFYDNVEAVVETVLNLHEAKAIKAVETAFGAVQVQTNATPAPFVVPTAAAAPVPAPAAAPVAAPVAIPGAADGDPQTAANWTAFFTAYQNGQVAGGFAGAKNGQWFDNRAGKKPTSPDFKVKGEKGQETAALWITGKGNPSWLTQALQQVGLAF